MIVSESLIHEILIKKNKFHSIVVEKYDGNLKELANDIGNLRYDALGLFLTALSEKILDDAFKDRERGRIQLYNALNETYVSLNQSVDAMNKAWKICRPFMIKEK